MYTNYYAREKRDVGRLIREDALRNVKGLLHLYIIFVVRYIFYKRVDWLRNREVLESREILYLVANRYT